MAYRNYIFTPLAKRDIEQAIEYIIHEFGDKEAAKRLYDGIFKTIEKIRLFPESYQLVDNKLIKNRNVRRALVGNYLLFYLYDEKNSMVVVLRFVHEKRSLVELLNEV